MILEALGTRRSCFSSKSPRCIRQEKGEALSAVNKGVSVCFDRPRVPTGDVVLRRSAVPAARPERRVGAVSLPECVDPDPGARRAPPGHALDPRRRLHRRSGLSPSCLTNRFFSAAMAPSGTRLLNLCLLELNLPTVEIDLGESDEKQFDENQALVITRKDGESLEKF